MPSNSSADFQVERLGFRYYTTRPLLRVCDNLSIFFLPHNLSADKGDGDKPTLQLYFWGTVRGETERGRNGSRGNGEDGSGAMGTRGSRENGENGENGGEHAPSMRAKESCRGSRGGESGGTWEHGNIGTERRNGESGESEQKKD